MMSNLITKARDWWKAPPQETGIVPVMLDDVEAAPAPLENEVKIVQHGFIQSLLSMERVHAETMSALSKATLDRVVRG